MLGLTRSRSSSNAATHSRERSATLASSSGTFISSLGTMNNHTPSDGSSFAGMAGGAGSIGSASGPPGSNGTYPPGAAPAQGMGGATGAQSMHSQAPSTAGSIGMPYSGPPPGIPQGPPPVPTLQGAPRGVPAGKEAGQNPDAIYQTIQEASARRISSLDYLKKTHEPRVFWFNTLLYTQPDIARMPSFSSSRLSRRASNFLLLGVSLPSVVDLNTQSPTEYLRALNELLVEFEDYEKQHPSDGTATGSLTRARMPSIFTRRNTGGGKRRTSSAADIGLPMQSSDPQELKNLLAQNSGTPGQTAAMPGGGGAAVGGGLGISGAGGVSTPIVPPLPPMMMPAPNADVPGGELAAGEDFSWLRTPSVPFEPDFFEVFVTLCDMLIECYSRITNLVSSPAVCVPETGDVFLKADSKIRKVVFEGIVKEFVDQTRAGVKTEIGGIGKIILGGLM